MNAMYEDLDLFTNEEKQRLFACYQALEERYRVSARKGSANDETAVALRGLSILGGTTALTLGDTWDLSDGERRCMFCILVSTARHKGVTHRGVQYDFDSRDVLHLAVADLGVDFGHVIMRPEGLIDKISELFQQREINFPEHPIFSKAYYVLADDEEKVRRAVTRQFLHEIASYDALLIEIVGGLFAASRERGINRDDALDIAGVCFDVQKALKQSF